MRIPSRKRAYFRIRYFASPSGWEVIQTHNINEKEAKRLLAHLLWTEQIFPETCYEYRVYVRRWFFGTFLTHKLLHIC